VFTFGETMNINWFQMRSLWSPLQHQFLSLKEKSFKHSLLLKLMLVWI